MGIQNCKNEGLCPFPRGDNKEIAKKFIDKLKKKYFLQNNQINFNKTCHKAFLGDGDSSLVKWKAPTFFKGRSKSNENNEDVRS